MTASQVRLALVGCPDDAAAYQDIARRLRHACFTTVVESDVDRGKSVAGSVGASVCASSLGTALREQGANFDAIVVRRPLLEREDAIRKSAEAGKHVLVQAPIAATSSATDAIVDRCVQAQVCLALGGVLRFCPSSQTIMERLSAGILGVPGLLRIHRWRPSTTVASREFAEHVFADIDLAACLFNETPDRIYAVGRKPAEHSHASIAKRDYFQVHFGFASGGMAILDFATALPEGQHYDSLTLIGSNGAAYADDHHNTHLLFGGGSPAALVSGAGLLHIVREHQAFVDAVLNQAPPPIGGEDCRRGMRLVDAILTSLNSGQLLQAKGASYELV